MLSTHDDDQFVNKEGVNRTNTKEIWSSLSWQIIISQDILKICASSLTFDIFEDFRPDLYELIVKDHPNELYSRIWQ